MRKASFFNNFSLSHSSLSEWIEICNNTKKDFGRSLSHSSLSEWIEIQSARGLLLVL